MSLAFVQGIHRGPVNSPHKWPVTRKMFPFHDVIMFVSNPTLVYVKYRYVHCFISVRCVLCVFPMLDVILPNGHKSWRHPFGPSYLKPLSGQYILWPLPISWTRQKATGVVSEGITWQRMAPEVCNHYGERHVRIAYCYHSNEIITETISIC